MAEEDNKQRQEAAEPEHAGGTANVPGGPGQGVWKDRTGGVSKRSTAGFGKGTDMERLGKPAQITVVPYSGALTQIPGLPDRKKISAW